ncbi:MAG: potassium-transporting ATPase subunit B, partial [Syntrophobacteraceae bacterium]|nr:potassium-transporting ATPase subunit B [Syntrophobacteraceae bacterium]
MSKEIPDLEKAAAHAHATLERPTPVRRAKPRGLLDKDTAKVALKRAFVMLRPDIQWNNPVMFVVLVGAVLTLLYIIQALLGRSRSVVPVSYFISLDVWLFLTVLFANFATALAEARGKAQAESLKKARFDTTAYRLMPTGAFEEVSSTALKRGDRVVVEAGQTIPGDGDIVEGIAAV